MFYYNSGAADVSNAQKLNYLYMSDGNSIYTASTRSGYI